jgi:hypothetical protein
MARGIDFWRALEVTVDVPVAFGMLDPGAGKVEEGIEVVLLPVGPVNIL